MIGLRSFHLGDQVRIIKACIKQWFPLKLAVGYMAFYFLNLTGYFFVSYIFYIKIKLNLLMHSVPITPVGMIKYLQSMANLACSRVCLLHSMAGSIMPVVVTKLRCKAFSDWSNNSFNIGQ